jgi:RNA polymerase sigma-70 factor (ECF subfamily)
MAWTYDGYRPTEIAAIMGMRAPAVRSALREARAKLGATYRAQDTP